MKLIEYMEENFETLIERRDRIMIGKLYLVGTPIGNLKDITLRALETLENCDLIAAEDTRQSLKLLNHFKIKKPMMSYHKFNEREKGNEIIDKLLEGKNVALVTDQDAWNI